MSGPYSLASRQRGPYPAYAAGMASHKAVVEAYVEGFRRGDHEAILACLAGDIVWVLHGYRVHRPAG
jgi:hypothetical protein